MGVLAPGAIYLERGHPVTVITRWRKPAVTELPSWFRWCGREHPAPRSVAVRRADGSVAVRPFRGLRKIRTEGEADAAS